MKLEVVATDGSNKKTPVSEAEAATLLIEQYGNADFLGSLRDGKAECASVSGGMLRKAAD